MLLSLLEVGPADARKRHGARFQFKFTTRRWLYQWVIYEDEYEVAVIEKKKKVIKGNERRKETGQILRRFEAKINGC